MALVTTISGVIGVLAAIALLLWFSAYMEARHLGPVVRPMDDLVPAAVPEGGQAVVAPDAVSSAA